MRLNNAYRKYARAYENGYGSVFYHPYIPAQVYFVIDFMEKQGVDTDNMTSLQHLFYITQGFVLDYEGKDNILAEYIADINGKSLIEAWELHCQHPLITQDVYQSVNAGFVATRDKSLKTVTPPTTDEETEKKD